MLLTLLAEMLRQQAQTYHKYSIVWEKCNKYSKGCYTKVYHTCYQACTRMNTITKGAPGVSDRCEHTCIRAHAYTSVETQYGPTAECLTRLHTMASSAVANMYRTLGADAADAGHGNICIQRYMYISRMAQNYSHSSSHMLIASIIVAKSPTGKAVH